MNQRPNLEKIDNRQLTGWKAIANALGKDESTVKRWAAKRGLPVHRVPGEKRASVYAWSDDLRNWLVSPYDPRKQDDVLATEGLSADMVIGKTMESAPSLRPGGMLVTLRGIILTIVGGAMLLAGTLTWLQFAKAPTAAYQTSDRVQSLYLDGVYLYQKRTPESLRQAEALLKESIALDATYAAPRSALAVTYDLMVEYGVRDAATGYGDAERLAHEALALDPLQSEAYAVLGDIAFFSERDYERGLSELSQSVAIAPANALSRHWYASALLSAGRYRDAYREIDATQRLEPTSRSVLVSKGMILLAAGNLTGAKETLTRLTINEPSYRSPYRFLSFVALAQHDYSGYLSMLEMRFSLTSDNAGLAVVAAARHGFDKGGYPMMVAEMAKAAQVNETGKLEPYFLAHVLALSGDMPAAAYALGLINTRHAFYYSFDPAFAPCRSNATFMAAIKASGLPSIR